MYGKLLSISAGGGVRTALSLTPRAKRDTFRKARNGHGSLSPSGQWCRHRVVNWAAWRLGKYTGSAAAGADQLVICLLSTAFFFWDMHRSCRVPAVLHGRSCRGSVKGTIGD